MNNMKWESRYAKPEDIDRLIWINREFADALRAGNTAGSASADEKFHEAIYRIADNRVLLNMIRELEGALYGYRVRACETGEGEIKTNIFFGERSKNGRSFLLQDVKAIDTPV